MFKVMPDEYFNHINTLYPKVEIDWHDKFLTELVNEQNSKKDAWFSIEENLDLTEFIQRVNYNKRWTYQGSLTTAPCDEGILWNVVENVIPIRQSTLDDFTKMRQVSEEQVVNKFYDADPDQVKMLDEMQSGIPDTLKSQ